MKMNVLHCENDFVKCRISIFSVFIFLDQQKEIYNKMNYNEPINTYFFK